MAHCTCWRWRSSRPGSTAGRCPLRLPEFRRRLRSAGRRDETPRRQGRRGRLYEPRTMYGIQQAVLRATRTLLRATLRQLDAQVSAGRLDFRSLRFPGLISAVTVPTGGTSDFAPEMLHAAAAGEPYACFVRPDTRIPFMAMPDAIAALLGLEAAPRERADAQGVQRRCFQPVGRGDATHRRASVSRRRHHVPGRREATGHRR